VSAIRSRKIWMLPKVLALCISEPIPSIFKLRTCHSSTRLYKAIRAQITYTGSKEKPMWNTIDATKAAMIIPRMANHLRRTNILSRIINAASSGVYFNSPSPVGDLLLKFIMMGNTPSSFYFSFNLGLYNNLPWSPRKAGAPVPGRHNFLQFV